MCIRRLVPCIWLNPLRVEALQSLHAVERNPMLARLDALLAQDGAVKFAFVLGLIHLDMVSAGLIGQSHFDLGGTDFCEILSGQLADALAACASATWPADALEQHGCRMRFRHTVALQSIGCVWWLHQPADAPIGQIFIFRKWRGGCACARPRQHGWRMRLDNMAIGCAEATWLALHSLSCVWWLHLPADALSCQTFSSRCF